MIDLNAINFNSLSTAMPDLLACVLVFSPLLSSIVVGLRTTKISNATAQGITTLSVTISAVLSLIMFREVVFGGNIIHIEVLRWFDIFSFQAHFSIYIDVLTAVMLIVVTSVSSLVHVYSIGYMSHDPHIPRFMSYLSLFTFCMLLLVTADNFLQLFLGWEGVGVSSYLLIGFWFKKKSAYTAGMKAFLVNRVGDFGFSLGIFTVFMIFGSAQFKEVFSQVESHSSDVLSIIGYDIHAITFACLLLFVGAMGKSAQLGLHTWLPDAMEGPTPVSALIHAATMVTAGVFMVARCSPLFEYAPLALNVVTIVGAFTCIFAASVSLVQTDIKRIIAFSTCSQLGYMFFACGVSAYSAAIFHLFTHAFFKALLFLGAGNVIHAMGNEQDIRKMGGIWRQLPYTYAMMWIGSLALAGVFPFAGYYSKDMILEAAYARGDLLGSMSYFLGIVAAVFTAFYSWRLIIVTFHGQPRASAETMEQVHESPAVMIIPLVILSIGAMFSGFIGDKILHMVYGDISQFWRDSIFVLKPHNTLELTHNIPTIVAILPSVAGVAGIAIAYLMYMYRTDFKQKVRGSFVRLHRLLLNKYYFDEMYNWVLVRPIQKLGEFLWRCVDRKIIDSIPNGLAFLAMKASLRVSKMHTGYINHYVAIMLIAVVMAFAWAVLYSIKIL